MDKNYIFGYVYFRQVKDKTLKRGYFQKSVVLLSKFPYVSLFNYILGLIAVEYFNTGAEVLETGRQASVDYSSRLVSFDHLIY